MEVHHHSHTSRKKWTHYLWEFLMLFLAVFCGFLAENQREHMVEHQREKTLIKSLVEDLKMDTLQLGEMIYFLSEKDKALDTIVIALKSPNVFDNSKELYRKVSGLFQNGAFIPSERTMQQLKNAGGLRLIRSQKASDSISIYDQELRSITLADPFRLTTINETTNLFKEIFDITQLDWIRLLPGPSTYTFLTKDQNKLNVFCNQIVLLKIGESTYKYNLIRIKRLAKQLILLLQKEYHLK